MTSPLYEWWVFLWTDYDKHSKAALVWPARQTAYRRLIYKLWIRI